MPVAAYKGRPIIPSESIKSGKDTSSSELFLLDMDQIEIWEILPTVSLMTDRDDFLTINALKTRNALITGHELVVRDFTVHGKLTDLA